MDRGREEIGMGGQEDRRAQRRETIRGQAVRTLHRTRRGDKERTEEDGAWRRKEIERDLEA